MAFARGICANNDSRDIRMRGSNGGHGGQASRAINTFDLAAILVYDHWTRDSRCVSQVRDHGTRQP